MENEFVLHDDLFNQLKNTCYNMVLKYMEDGLLSNMQWSNNYGYLAGNQRTQSNNKVRYNSIDDMTISFHKIHNAIYFTILPKKFHHNNTPHFDGYFLISDLETFDNCSDFHSIDDHDSIWSGYIDNSYVIWYF